MKKAFYNAKIVTPTGVLEDVAVLVENGVIVDFIKNKNANFCDGVDCKGNYLLAGFIDIHCHGGGGADFMDGSVDAIEKVDACLGQIINIMKEKKGLLIVTADHGNCEEMLTENNEIITSHSLNKVPFIIMKKGLELKEEGSLCHIAPTILKLMNIEIPKEMTKETLIKDN